MKRLLFHLLLALHMPVYAQYDYPFQLSTTLHESRMGVWVKGDYKICIGLGVLATSFRKKGKSFTNAGGGNNYEKPIDTIYTLTAKRFLSAAGQLQKAGNGFDLRKLVVYYGRENNKQNSGNSLIVETAVRELLEIGQAAVYYKGKRVYQLTRRNESKGEALDFGFDVLIYFDNVDNYIFKYHEHLGW